MINPNLKLIPSKKYFEIIEECINPNDFIVVDKNSTMTNTPTSKKLIKTEVAEYKSLIYNRDKFEAIGYRNVDFTRYEYYIDSDNFYIYAINIYKDLNELIHIQIFHHKD